MLALAFLLALQTAAPQAGPFAPLAAYNGTWRIKAQHSFSGGSRPDTLENRCTTGVAFYTCEQILNGKSVGLVVFNLSREPGKFDVDRISPNGHADSDTDLVVEHDHWTYITNSATGKPHYRTENIFHGPDNLHFETFKTDDGGRTWTKSNEGDETRVP